VYDSHLLLNREKLSQVLNKRKYEAMPLVLEIFNSIQKKKVGKTFKLDDFEQHYAGEDYSILKLNQAKNLSVDKNAIQNDRDFGSSLQRLEMLLVDSRSPMLGALKDTAKYKTEGLPDDPNEYYETGQSYVTNPVDIDRFQRDLDKLKILEKEAKRIYESIGGIHEQVKHAQSNTDGSQNSVRFNEWQTEGKQKVQDALEGRIQQLYQEYKQSITS
jgi:hypothetical protein